MKCKYCGGKLFGASMTEYHDAVVDGNGNWQEDLGCRDSDHAYGPFTCQGCGAEYKELCDGAKVNRKPYGYVVKDNVTKMVDGLGGFAETSPMLLAMAQTAYELGCEDGAFCDEEAYLLAMAIYHPKGILSSDPCPGYTVADYINGANAALLLPGKDTLQKFLDCVFLGPDVFNPIIVTLADYAKAVHSDDVNTAETLRVNIPGLIDHALATAGAGDTIKDGKKKYAETGFIW